MRSRSFLLGVAVLLGSSSAQAGGLFMTDRGVRPLGRGGAFVAGADDLGAIWYNPAGLADAGSSVLVDFSWLNFSAEYTRSTLVTDAGGTVRQIDFPQVKGSSPFLPIPTIAGSYNFGKEKEYTAAIGIFAPYTAIASYPLNVNGQPAPSRYSLVSLEGSALVVAGGYFAYKPIEQFRVGLGLQALVGNFNATTVFSASPPDRLIGAPEDPQYDAFSQLAVGPIVSPSGNLGMIAEPSKYLRLGVSGQLPFWVNAPAKIKVRLPTAAPFDNARQVGEDANVRFVLPAVARVGAELRTDFGDASRLRIELAYVREFWSMHDSIDIRPSNIKLHDITGFPSPFGVAPISLPKNFQDSNSIRLGTEYSLKNLLKEYWIDLRAGISYETSGVPRAWVAPQTYDADKVVASVGGGLHIGQHWRMDALAALALLNGTSVDPAEAQVPRVNPVKGNPTDTEKINGGLYAARALILGVGVNYKF
ncbi:MAG: outer membrane protein transport protein [Labilithrix sp.]|nr:outer membrane protein transport protein [Labilithrix sp.]MCW5815922.1 outer membrane protein transport protein [Labilithrix sp.]